MTALAGFTIIEIAGRVCGEYATKLLADFGAEVIKIEPREGCPTRRIGPFVDGESTLFRYLNTNKKSVIVDLAAQDGPDTLTRLLSRADALITDLLPDQAAALHLVPDEIAASHPHLVHCAITPLGQSAPRERQTMLPINVLNASGWAYHTPSESPPDKPPLKGPGRFLSDYEAGLEAALAISASLWRKRKTGKGQFIDISAVATLLSRTDCVLGRMLAGEQEPGPERTRYDMGGPGSTFACADGYVFLVATNKAHWLGLTALMGNPEWTQTFPGDWLEFHCTAERVADFRQHFSAWLLGQTKDAVSEAAQKLGVALVQVNTAADLPAHPQYQHRSYFQSLDGLAYPTVPYKMSASPVRLKTTAPPLGAHQGEFG